ncbi:MAG: cyclic nucleotide-binding domain-containing protein [Thermoleophilaceae bacterium]|nr:cyclic nucleotide-binding domain-containing protein [Thermoleophilaceae bacterium]
MSEPPVTLAELRSIDLFDDLDDEQLAEWVSVAKPFHAEPGEVIAEHGRPAAGVVLLIEGRAEALLVDGDRLEPAGHHQAPTWMGAISVLTGGLLGVRMQAETVCRWARVERDDFRPLAFAQPSVHERVMRQVAPVMSRITAMEQNRERLASLGTMAAGLAHELNNPAAAAQRAAAQMADALEVVSSTIDRFVHSGIERADAEQLVQLQRQAVENAQERSGLEAADAEDELLDRLEALGVPRAWELVEPLASAGVDEAWLDRVAELAGPATDAAVGWVAATLTARGLAEELQESTQRMSDLVKAVKTYAYMDRGELVEVDLHEGINTTIKVLKHRLKHTDIQLERHYDESLPKLTVRGSELNQVWTNLIDNAIDALGDSGTITITTRHNGQWAEVEVADDGPGVSADAREHLFDSFYTTKEIGQGTGLGLATALRIVADRHDGTLTVESEPGRTVFLVRLPLTRT